VDRRLGVHRRKLQAAPSSCTNFMLLIVVTCCRLIADLVTSAFRIRTRTSEKITNRDLGATSIHIHDGAGISSPDGQLREARTLSSTAEVSRRRTATLVAWNAYQGLGVRPCGSIGT